MFRIIVVACGLGTATALLSLPAQALSLTNRDAHPHLIEISDGESRSTLRLKPDHRVRGLCQQGCTLSLDTGARAEFVGEEAVVIEDGEFLVEE